MNPPLDALPLHSPEPRMPLAAVGALTPVGVHDLRGRTIDELRYPTTAALIFAGVPGAGKSTALRKFFGATAQAEEPPTGPSGSIVLDSQHARNRWRHRLGWLPYPLWRPVVHIAHYAGIKAALRDADGPVVIHDCGTFGWSRRMIARWAAAYRRDLHVVMLDVPPTVARAGQYARGRRINGMFFTLHCRRWDRLIRDLDTEDRDAPVPSSSVVIVDRSTVDRMSRVAFDG
ncbi:hypothetical protein AB0H49_15385 [Nocardia sp. NPDC050713]|uniref:hypothetical protein n=1 Tax=Nocardia sp. NPDC050713 TaxID=3154511 RepID=UPI00340D727D